MEEVSGARRLEAVKEVLTALLCFCVLAEERSISKAATRLGITQPAMSHMLKRLESRLQLQLVQRGSQTSLPTQAGEKLLNGVAPAFRAIEDVLASMQIEGTQLRARLRVAVPQAALEVGLFEKICSFAQLYPHVQLEVMTAAFSSLDDANGFDAIINAGEITGNGTTTRRVTADTQTLVVVSPELLTRVDIPQMPEDLTERRCIVADLSLRQPRWAFRQDGRELIISLRDVLRFDEPRFAIQAAQQGLGFARLARGLVEASLQAGTLVQVLESWSMDTPGFFLAYRVRRDQSPALEPFIDILTAESLIRD